jgi:hypothetical protein
VENVGDTAVAAAYPLNWLPFYREVLLATNLESCVGLYMPLRTRCHRRQNLGAVVFLAKSLRFHKNHKKHGFRA